MKRISLSLLIVTVLLLCVTGIATQAQQPYKGETVTILLIKGQQTIYIQQHVADFEKKTGIKVDYEVVAEKDIYTKMQMALAAETGEYDAIANGIRIFMTAASAGWLADLKPLINDPKYTQPEWNFADFPSEMLAALTVDEKLLAIPFLTETVLVYWDKRDFARAGLANRAPNNLEELEEYCQRLNHPEEKKYAWAQRAKREGSQNGFGWIMLWMTEGGKWREPYRPDYVVLDTIKALKTTEYYTRLLNNYGPPGIAAWGWDEVLTGMKQGMLAMMLDSSSFGLILDDPEQSKVAGHLGCGIMKGTGGATVPAPFWGYSIVGTTVDKGEQKLGATWEWLKWATSQETFLNELSIRVDLPRISVVNSDAYKQAIKNQDFAKALSEAIQHADPEPTPLIPEGPEIRSFHSIAISAVLSGQKEVYEAMKEANEKTYDLLKKVGRI